MPLRSIDRLLGLGLGALGAAVFWSARSLPAVPGQKLGAGFLPMLVGAGLVACALGLLWRSWRGGGPDGAQAPTAHARGDIASAAVIAGSVLAYILWADALGFLLIGPLCLLASFLALKVRPLPALGWAIAGTLVVHLAFYKLMRVPLPWGLLRPLY